MIVKRYFRNTNDEQVEITTECDRIIKTNKDGQTELLLYKDNNLIDDTLLDYEVSIYVMEKGVTVDTIKYKPQS